MKSIGKIGKRNLKANKSLKAQFEEKEIYTCEIREAGCMGSWFLGFAHRHERAWYYPKDKQHLLGSMSQVLLGCQSCHYMIDNNKELRERVFIRLRGPEQL